MMPSQILPLVYKMLGHAAGLVGIGGMVAVVDFTSKITLGSVVTTVVLIAIAGLFTVRSKIANIWREEAEGERAAKERLQEELIDARTDRALFDKQQQELRHELKNQIAGLNAQLAVLEAKTDLTSALEAIKTMNETAVQTIAEVITATFVEKSKHEHDETHRLLSEIRDKLPGEPIAVNVIHDSATD